jgi:hypothetical protein
VSAIQADASPGPPNHARRTALVNKAKQGLFLTFITLSLIFPSPTRGPLNWLPLVRVSGIDEAPVALGPLVLLPGLALIAWFLARVLERPSRPWRWSRPGITLPLAGLTLLMLLSLEPALNQRTVVVILSLGLLWWVYLFIVNEAPSLTIPLTLVIAVQGSVAVGQFAFQGDLGLSALGEPTLDPERSGVCVLFARGQRWLRAYGLSGHPNLLGAVLSISLLLIIDDATMKQRRSGWARVWFALVASAGILGLLTTFSRSAWLAFGVGLLAWLLRRALHRRISRGPQERRPLRGLAETLRQPVQFVVPVVLALLFLLLYHDLVASRFLHLETPIEARSVSDRQVDANLALRLIRQHPWRGVGVNNYLVAVRAIETDSRTVHNVPLLTAAELGLPGAALWIWLALSGLTRPQSPAWPPWIAMLIAGLFDVALFPTNSWYAATVFGLLAAHTSLPRRNRALEEDDPPMMTNAISVGSDGDREA